MVLSDELVGDYLTDDDHSVTTGTTLIQELMCLQYSQNPLPCLARTRLGVAADRASLGRSPTRTLRVGDVVVQYLSFVQATV